MTEVYATPQTQTAARPGGSAPSLGARPILSVRQIEKVYGNRDSVTRAINDISFDVAPGEFVGIMGPSGSGKTTLLNCVATIDTVTSGHILVDGRDITGLRSRALAKFRRDDLGFIFQDSNLLDTLTGFENIALALTVKGGPPPPSSLACRLSPARWAWTRCLASTPTRCPEARSSASPRRGPWSPIRSSCWPTSPRARSIRAAPR